MAKKKKPVGNPARGFATTSIASTPKAEKSIIETTADVGLVKISPGSKVPSSSNTIDGVSITVSSEKTNNERETHELSPEELEQRLEEGELQSLVDKFATKCARDTSRYVNRVTTEYRLLRNHAQPFSFKGMLSDELFQRALGLAQEDIEEGRILFADGKVTEQSVPSEEELILKLWTLKQALLHLGFELEQVQSVLAYTLQHPPVIETGNGVWGMEECLDWLTLTVPEEQLPPGDGKGSSGHVVESYTPSNSGSDTPVGSESTGSNLPTAMKVTHNNSDNGSNDDNDNDEQVSDLESDLEPDELLSTYVSTKLRLYEIDPVHAQVNDRKSKTSESRIGGPPKISTSTVRKLQNRITKIESDMLFNKQEAEQQWLYKRNEKAQELADRRRLQLPMPPRNVPQLHDIQQSLTTSDTDPSTGVQTPISEASDEDDTALADLFASATDTEPSVNRSDAPGKTSTVAIRDIGPVQGITPWRVLEDACKARDPQCKISFQLMSQSAFSNRSAVSIIWSKRQIPSYPLQYDGISSTANLMTCTFTMINISSPDAQQSKAFVSTFALYQLFSVKEDKLYIRLGSAWRALWREFVDLTKAQNEAADRDTVQQLRKLIRGPDRSDEDRGDVVLFQNSRERLKAQAPSRVHEVTFSEGISHKIHSHEEWLPNSTDETSNDVETQLAQAPSETQQHLKDLWASKASTRAFNRMLSQRKSLPMFSFRDAALSIVEQNQVTILCGETGCGKSTQMPSFILESELSQGRPCKIYCTEPRRISALTLAHRVTEELGDSKGDVGTSKSLVGYAIRLESKVVSTTRLVYATTGIVLRMLESKNGFEDVTHVVIDEVHERSIETDFLLIILKSLVRSRPQLKVILMSATVDAQKFSSYFKGAPIITVPGRTFPVDARFLEDAIELTGYTSEDNTDEGLGDTAEMDEHDQPAQTSKPGEVARLQGYSAKTRSVLLTYNEYRIDYPLILKLINHIAFGIDLQQYSKAILVFLPGIAEIRRLNNILHGTKLSQFFLIHILHSTIASEDQQAAFTIPPRGMRKIVLSTNIAETGVTIPDITCVIDSGKHKEMRFDERRQISRLIESFISRANAKQRRGRAGRVQEGLCFHLFTKSRHDEVMADQQSPEMLRLSLQDLVMRVKICKLGDIQSTLAEALDPPLAKNVRRAIDTLIDVGALDAAENLTPLGQQLSKLPLDPYLGKLVLFGAIFGCLDTCLTLAGMLTSKSPFVSPMGAHTQLDAVRQYFKTGDSDLLTDYNAYAAWRRVCSAAQNATGLTSENQFCRKNLLSVQTLCNIEDLKAQLLSAVAESGIIKLSSNDRSHLSRVQNSPYQRARRFVVIPSQLDSNAANIMLVSSVVAWSFYPKLLVSDGKGWRNVATNQSISIHPTSVLRISIVPSVKFLSFYSILQSSGTKHYNASSLTPTSSLALLLLAGDATFHPVAHVISIDGARLRFAFDGWKAAVVAKYLRRRLDEYLNKMWKGRAMKQDTKTEEATLVGTETGFQSGHASVGAALGRWVELWNLIIDSWAENAK